MDNPRITVLMPAYDAALYIAAAIDSVLAQTFTDFELLIINDGSTDGTAAIVQSYKDERIIYFEQHNQGIAIALNSGLAKAKAPIIARFDADDICLPDRLQYQFDFLEKHPEYIVVGAAVDYMDEGGEFLFNFIPPFKSNDEIQAMTYNNCPFIHSAVMYKKDVIAATGYNPNAHSFEDHLLWLNIRSKGKMHNLTESLVRVRLSATSFTMDERKRPGAFHAIKNKALQTGFINQSEGDRLLMLIKKQQDSRSKRAAYYNLLAKKFLWNNYQPGRARENIKKAHRIQPFDLHNIALWILSYLPQKIVKQLYSRFGTSS